MSETILAAKFICLFFGIAYGTIVLVQGAIYGRSVSQGQNFFCAAAWAGFVTLQWLL